MSDRRYSVIRFDRNEQPIATADFATREQADDCYAEFIKLPNQKRGGVQMVSPNGFVVKRFMYRDADR